MAEALVVHSPVRPALPAVKKAGWVRNPIDAFVLHKLEQEGCRQRLKPVAKRCCGAHRSI